MKSGDIVVRSFLSLNVWLLTTTLIAQQNAPEMTQSEIAQREDSTPTFQSKVNLVLVPVVVRDSQGRVIAGLTKDDFQLFDKGKRQTIAAFSVTQRPAITGQQSTPASSSPDTAPLNISPERYVAYLFDDLNIEAGDLMNLKKAAAKNFASGLLPGDRAAIFTTSGQITLDFNDDKAKLAETLSKIQRRPMFQHAGKQCPNLSYYLADLIENKHDPIALDVATQETMACMNMDSSEKAAAQQMAQAAARQELQIGEQGTRISLGVVKDVIHRLGFKPGQRLMVLASPGFLAESFEALSDKTQILDSAASLNVMISSLNARGLFTTNMDASQEGASSPNDQRLVEQYARQSAMATEDVLAELADGTGGTFFHNNNDLNAGFARVASAPEVSYVLGFSPTALKPDGSFHRLKISLVTRNGATIQARRGYVAVKHGTDAEAEAKSDIQDAMFSREEMRDIPVDLQTQFFKPSDNSAKLTVVAKVDLRRLPFKKLDGRNLDNLTVVSALFDRNGNYITGMTKNIQMRLRDETLAKLAAGISVKTSFDVKPGGYVVRLVVRDSEGHQMAAQNGAVEIP